MSSVFADCKLHANDIHRSKFSRLFIGDQLLLNSCKIIKLVTFTTVLATIIVQIARDKISICHQQALPNDANVLNLIYKFSPWHNRQLKNIKRSQLWQSCPSPFHSYVSSPPPISPESISKIWQWKTSLLWPIWLMKYASIRINLILILGPKISESQLIDDFFSPHIPPKNNRIPCFPLLSPSL